MQRVDVERARPGARNTGARFCTGMDPTQQALWQLVSAVYRYLQAPGCNANSRATAFARLRHAAETAGAALPDPPAPPDGDE